MKKFFALAIAFTMIMTLGVGTSMARMGFGGGNNTVIMDHVKDDLNTLKQKFGNKGPKHHNVIRQILRCLKDVGVSDETKEAIRSLIEEHKTVMEERVELMKEARKAYWVALTSAELDEAALADAEDALLTLKTENMEFKFDLTLDIRALLSDEEIEALANCFEFEEESQTKPDTEI